MLRYHVTVINGLLFFVLISRTVSWLGVCVGQIRQNVSRPFFAPLIPSAIHAHLCLFAPGGRQWKKPGNIFHVYCVFFFAVFPYAYHLGRFSPNDSVRRIHKRGQRKPGWQAAPPIRWRNPENGWRRFISVADLVIPKPAQRELEEIAMLHLNLVGPDSARNITNLILDPAS